MLSQNHNRRCYTPAKGIEQDVLNRPDVAILEIIVRDLCYLLKQSLNKT